MKKLFIKYFLFCILFIIIGCQSCKKDPMDPNSNSLIPTYTLTAIADDGVTIFPKGITKVQVGNPMTYTITCGPNKKFVVKVNGVIDGEPRSTGTYTYKIDSVDSDKNIEVVSFSVYTVKVSTSNGGSVEVGTISVDAGGTASINIILNSGYSIKSINVDGVDRTISNPYKLENVTGNIDVKIDFIFTDMLTIITPAYWCQKSVKYIQNGVVASDVLLTEKEKTDQLRFTLDGKVYVNGAYGGTWSLDISGHITIGTPEYTYTFENGNKEIICRMDSQYYGKPAILEITYWTP